MNPSDDIIIIETKKIDVDNPIVLEGVPDMGLVGSIAVSHLIQEQNFEDVGYIKSDLFSRNGSPFQKSVKSYKDISKGQYNCNTL